MGYYQQIGNENLRTLLNIYIQNVFSPNERRMENNVDK